MNNNVDLYFYFETVHLRRYGFVCLVTALLYAKAAIVASIEIHFHI